MHDHYNHCEEFAGHSTCVLFRLMTTRSIRVDPAKFPICRRRRFSRDIEFADHALGVLNG